MACAGLARPESDRDGEGQFEASAAAGHSYSRGVSHSAGGIAGAGTADGYNLRDYWSAIGEMLGPKWEEINFSTSMADVLRSYSDGAIGPRKTEISEQPVPLNEIVLEGLQVWQQICDYPEPGDWVFASDHSFGKTRLWPDSLRAKILQPTARRIGITKRTGWLTFRRTYS